MRHQAYGADYQEYEWLFRHADTGIWYEKASKSSSAKLAKCDTEPFSTAQDKVLAVPHAKPLSLELPKVWASAGLTTLLDDVSRGTDAASSSGSQYQSTSLAQSEAMPLVYCLVISTFDADHTFPQEAHYKGRHIYKLIKCGSREAAVLEAFYAAGVHGWNVLFTCVMRLGDEFEEKPGKAMKVRLAQLAREEAEAEKEGVRVFY